MFPSAAVVNIKVMQRYLYLSAGLFDALSDKHHQSVIVVGVPQFLAIPLSIAKAAIPSVTSSSWAIIQDRDDVEQVVTNTGDIPHWYYDSGDERKENAARRCPLDPREYWCWRRCLSEDRKISLKDTFNPDPETWLEDCEAEIAESSNIDATILGKLDAIPERQDEEDW